MKHNFPLVEKVLSSIREPLVTSKVCEPLLYPMCAATASYVCYYCILRVIMPCWLLLEFIGVTAGQTIDCISPLAAFITPSGTVRAKSQEGGFQVRSSLNLLNLSSEAYGLFITPGRQQRETK